MSGNGPATPGTGGLGDAPEPLAANSPGCSCELARSEGRSASGTPFALALLGSILLSLRRKEQKARLV